MIKPKYMRALAIGTTVVVLGIGFQNCADNSASKGADGPVSLGPAPLVIEPNDRTPVASKAIVDDAYGDIPATYTIEIQASGRVTASVAIADEVGQTLKAVISPAEGTRLREVFGRIYSYPGGDASCLKLDMPGYAVYQIVQSNGVYQQYTIGRRKTGCDTFNEFKPADKEEIFRILADVPKWEQSRPL